MRTIVLSGALFLSGLSALIFETLWLQLSGLAFGNSVSSAALILSSFMAGLAIGNALAGVAKLRRIRPVYAYAALEVTVAVVGCLVVFALPWVGTGLRTLFRALWEHQTLLLALRFIASFVILLVPTTAMGLTLPVLLADPLLRRHSFGGALGILYGCNTLGAVAGAVMGEACLIRSLGLIGTGLAAGAANCVAAILALSLARRSSEVSTQSECFKVGKKPWRLLSISFTTGLLLLCLEVVWFRFLRLYVASSTVAFATMLAVVLAGIGLGGALSGLIHLREKRRTDLLPILLLASAIATLLSYLCFPGSTSTSEGPFDVDRWTEIAFMSAALMFPVACISGVLFPAVAANVQELIGGRMNSTGLTTVANTAGATVGPLLASFVLLPMLGFQTSLLICAAAYAAVALVAVDYRSWSVRRASALVQLVLFASFVATLVLFPYGRASTHFGHARELYAPEGSYLVKKKDGTSDTFQLLRHDLYGEPYYYRLLTNSFSMSATSPFGQRYMRLFAYLPLILNPEAKSALLICYGCGITADALTRSSQLAHIDMVDISKEVFSFAPDYQAAGYTNPLKDPRVRHIVQDGRFFLHGSPVRYDVITGEPPPLKVAGTVNLYTAEFFSLMASRLNDGGVATFWLPIYQLTPEETKAVLRAFYDAFPNASLWSGTEEEWIMMGIKGERRSLTNAEVSRWWNDEKSRTDLVRIGLETPEQIACSFLMDSSDIAELTRSTPPLTDNYPKRLGDTRADDAVTYRFAWKYIQSSPALSRFSSSTMMQSLWPSVSPEDLKPYFELRQARFLSKVADTNKFAELDSYLRNTRLRSPVLAALGSDEFRVEIAERVSRKGAALPVEALSDLVASALARRDIPNAVILMERKLHEAPKPDDVLLLSYLYCVDGRVAAAETLANEYGSQLEKQPFAQWMWQKLQTDFGFHPPA